MLSRQLHRLHRLARRLSPRLTAHQTPLAKPAASADPRIREDDLRLLVASRSFDHRWYAEVASCSDDRTRAARHYLRVGHTKSLSPNPLFDPAHYLHQRRREGTGGQAPFVDFLRQQPSATLTPSPWFDVERYCAARPEASRHPEGPLGDYLENVGRVDLPAPNGWYRPGDGNPANLAEWVRARRHEWTERGRAVPRLSALAPELVGHVRKIKPSSQPLVSVIVIGAEDVGLTTKMLRSVRAQTWAAWEIVLVHDDRSEVAAVAAIDSGAPERLVPAPSRARADALAAGLAAADGTFVAWLMDGDLWEPGHLRDLVGALKGSRAAAAHSVVELRTRKPRGKGAKDAGALQRRFAVTPATVDTLRAGLRVPLSSVVARRSALTELGGVDRALPNAADHDLICRLVRQSAMEFVPSVTVVSDARLRRRSEPTRPPRSAPPVEHAEVDTWHDVVVNREFVDWEALAQRSRHPAVVSVVILTYRDSHMTIRAVETVARAAERSDLQVQILVADNGSDAPIAIALDSLPLRFPGVQVLHFPINHGFALGNNFALPHVTGETVVFLNNDTEVSPGWLEPLVSALADPEVLGAQSLLVYPSGAVQSAGIAFPAGGGIPHPLLQGFPSEDAAGLESAPLHAITAAAVAFRTADVLALRGFDPLFRNGMEDVDLGLRLHRLRPGRCTVRPDSLVVHLESRTPGRFQHAMLNRRLLLDRWGADMPGDDVALWAHVGYDVIGYEQRPEGPDRRVEAPAPVLTRRRRAAGAVSVEPRPLRWAIKNPAPGGTAGDHWGDTHFAAHLAAALRRCGQDVVVDRRQEFYRSSGRHDDVVLVLRGLVPYQPQYGQVNLEWLISHPEVVTRRELASYDRVFAASVPWARATSAEWEVRIDPLLQATDTSVFHPDAAPPDTGPPVLFVGSSRSADRPLILWAAEHLPVAVYGPDWAGRIPAERIAGTSFPNSQLGSAYRSARIVLNDHWEDMRVAGFVSNRLFDAAAAGARVISDPVEGVKDLFGRSVQTVSSPEELVALARTADLDRIFGDDAERRAVAARIHAEHSFDARANSLVEAALEVRATLSQSRRQAHTAHGPR